MNRRQLLKASLALPVIAGAAWADEIGQTVHITTKGPFSVTLPAAASMQDITYTIHGTDIDGNQVIEILRPGEFSKAYFR